MFTIDDDKTIHITRGDIGSIEVSSMTPNKELYVFQPGDIVRLRIYVKKQHDNVVLVKNVHVETETTVVDILLDKSDTKIGGIINKPVDYWYEVELNPDTAPQTLVGYDKVGPKIFRLYPEGGDAA